MDLEGFGYGMEAVGAYNYIYKAQQLGVNVVAINNSWGGAGEESYILEALINLVGENGAISVCAAGNSSEDNDTVEALPSNIDSPYVIAVAASNEKDELAKFSSYGANKVDIAAPGTDILSTVSYTCFNPGIYEDSDKLCALMEDFSDGKLVQTIEDGEYIEPDDEWDDDEWDDDEESIDEDVQEIPTEGMEKTTKKISTNTGVTVDAMDDAELSEHIINYGLDATGEYDEMSVELSKNAYFGEKTQDSQSLQWTITGAKSGECYNLYLPYTVTEDNDNQYVSVMTKVSGPSGAENIDPDDWFAEPSATYVCDSAIDEDGYYNEDDEIMLSGTYIDENNYWDHNSAAVDAVEEGDTRAVAIQVWPAVDGDFVVNVDNFGVSKSGVSEEEFGKYDFYNGTSMATPYVTGAVAAVANLYTEESALGIKSRVIGSTRKSESLQGKVSTGGVLDLSKLQNPNMSIESAYLNEENRIVIDGFYLDKASVKVNDKEVEVIEQTDESIVFDGSSYLNKNITITIAKGDDSISLKRFFTIGQGFDYGIGVGGYLEGGNAVSTGDELCYVNDLGAVYTGVPTEVDGLKSLDWTCGEFAYHPGVFGDEYAYCVDAVYWNQTEVVYGNGKLWTVLSIDVGFSEDTALICYDEETGWTKVASIPKALEDATGYTLAAYNGDIYLLGGYAGETCSKSVFKYDAENNTWKDAPELPEGRVYAKALQSGNKLVVTLGGNNDGVTESNLIFDGETWSKSKTAIGNVCDVETITIGEKTIDIATAEIGIVEDGIVYTNCLVEDLGDTFIYNVSKDAYESTGYRLDKDSLYYDHLVATTVQNELYVLFGFEEVEFYEDWMATKKKALSEDEYEYVYEDEDSSYDSYIEILSMPVSTGFVKVVDNSDKGAKVLNAGYYVPGESIRLTAEVEEDHFIKGMTVNNEKVEVETTDDGTFCVLPNVTTSKELAVAVKVGAYVTEVKIPAKQELAPGKSVKLSANVIPANADNKSLIWESSDHKVITVDKDGKLTAAANAVPGTKVTISASSADRALLLAECQVVIKEEAASTEKTTQEPTSESTEESNLPAVGSKVQVGKATYKVLANSATSKTVAFVSWDNKKSTKVTVPATVKVNGKDFKVTQISDKAFKNCKKLKSVTIGKNVTTIGKNIFTGCKKLTKITMKSSNLKKVGKNKTSNKITVKVPKKKKKAYKKLFSKAKMNVTVK